MCITCAIIHFNRLTSFVFMHINFIAKSFPFSLQHNIKKIRNGILKSGTGKHHVRLLRASHVGEGLTIEWQHWVKAFHWDQENHSFPIHRFLTEAHLSPSNTEKMRNKLAEDVLGKEMLGLMQVGPYIGTI